MHEDLEETMYFVHKGGTCLGPWTATRIHEALISGEVSDLDYGWTKSLTGWRPLGEVLGLERPRHVVDRPPVFRFRKHLRAADIRVEHERRNLYLTIGGTCTCFLFFNMSTFLVLVFPMVLLLLFCFAQVQYKASALKGRCVRIGKNQMPETYDLFQDTCSRLDAGEPELYVTQDNEVNASAMSLFGKEVVVVNSGLFHAMNHGELQFVLGHEITHIKCGHNFWNLLASRNPLLYFGPISSVSGWIMRFWSRQAEYTADRGGLIACKDLNVATSALAKLAVGKELYEKLNLEEFLNQTGQIESDHLCQLAEGASTHPFLAKRVRALIDFYNSPQYMEILSSR